MALATLTVTPKLSSLPLSTACHNTDCQQWSTSSSSSSSSPRASGRRGSRVTFRACLDSIAAQSLNRFIDHTHLGTAANCLFSLRVSYLNLHLRARDRRGRVLRKVRAIFIIPSNKAKCEPRRDNGTKLPKLSSASFWSWTQSAAAAAAAADCRGRFPAGACQNRRLFRPDLFFKLSTIPSPNDFCVKARAKFDDLGLSCTWYKNLAIIVV